MTMRRVMVGWLCVLFALPAGAQTLSMDRMRGQSEFGLRMDFGFPKEDGDLSSREAYWRNELHGQIAFGGWGAYFSVPLARNITSRAGREEFTAFGNLELGGFHTMGLGSGELVLRFGLTLPTADDSIGGFSTNAFSNYGRITDHINTQPNAMGARLSASPIFEFGPIFFKGDVGVDILWAVGDNAFGREEVEGFQAFFRGNIGLGANLGIVTLAIESVNLLTMADSAFAFGLVNSDKSIHTLTAGGWVNLSFVHPYVAFTVPLDDFSRERYGFVFTLGADIRI